MKPIHTMLLGGACVMGATIIGKLTEKAPVSWFTPILQTAILGTAIFGIILVVVALLLQEEEFKRKTAK